MCRSSASQTIELLWTRCVYQERELKKKLPRGQRQRLYKLVKAQIHTHSCRKHTLMETMWQLATGPLPCPPAPQQVQSCNT